jgi:hypothetical protein
MEAVAWKSPPTFTSTYLRDLPPAGSCCARAALNSRLSHYNQDALSIASDLLVFLGLLFNVSGSLVSYGFQRKPCLQYPGL